MVYQFRSDARLTTVVKQKEKQICARLARLAERNGALRAEDAVADGADPNSPLHNVFEWDDTLAAHEYRLEQARYLIRSVVVTDEDVRREPFRAYVHVGRELAYQPTSKALTDDALREQVLQEALAELEEFEAKYADLEELAEIFQVLNNLRGAPV